jgi:ankyrin repeat protein
MKAFKEWERSSCGNFFNAVYGKKLSIAQTLLEREPGVVKCKLPDGMTPLHFIIFAAVRNSDYSAAQFKMANFLLDNKADVNASEPPLGMSPLHLAAFDDSNEDFVDLLIKRGAKIDAMTIEGSLTPLHVATINGSANIVRRLIKAGSPVDQPDGEGYTALHRASIMNLQKVAETLVASKANVNVRATHNNRTPAHLAAKFCNAEVAQLLVKARADVDATDKKGLTPKAIADANNCMAVAGIYAPYMRTSSATTSASAASGTSKK